MPSAQVFVGDARRHVTHTNLGGDIGGAFDGGALVLGQNNFEWCAAGGDHALGKPTDNLQALGVDIHQPEFAHRQAFDAIKEAIDQFGRVGGTSTDHSDFHRISPCVFCL